MVGYGVSPHQTSANQKRNNVIIEPLCVQSLIPPYSPQAPSLTGCEGRTHELVDPASTALGGILRARSLSLIITTKPLGTISALRPEEINKTTDNMPSATYAEPPAIAKWKRPEHTTEKLDWADIKIIDLSTFDEPNGKQKLAEELRDAVIRTLLRYRLSPDTRIGTPHWLFQHNWHRPHSRRGRSAIRHRSSLLQSPIGRER
jgi:hypothetical protein